MGDKTLVLVTPLVERQEETISVPSCRVGSSISQDFIVVPSKGG